MVDCLKLFKKVEVPDGNPRWCEEDQRAAGRGIRITGGGISSSIDESLYIVGGRLVEDLTGDREKAVEASRAIQLAIQYRPGPPNTPPEGGDPGHVDPSLLEWMVGQMSGFHDPVCQAVRQRIGTASANGDAVPDVKRSAAAPGS